MYTDGTIHFTDIYLRNNQQREIVRKKERERERIRNTEKERRGGEKNTYGENYREGREIHTQRERERERERERAEFKDDRHLYRHGN